jgi:aromatic ring hydroxylase
MKGTGFKDEETAKRTLKLISKRDLTYQKQVVNTMYNRAKFHPNQTVDMRKAMRVYNKWLLKH